MSRIAKQIFDWVDERAGLRELSDKMLNEPMPGGSRYAYVFGSILVYIFVIQLVTGILLMFYYAPTADHAYESTQYIINNVEYGWFILSFHFWSSSVMVVMVVIHMSQVFLWGAYKKPSELVWVVGTVLFVLVVAMGFTGYLLPWDQRSFWATTVGIEIADKVPLIGDFIGQFLRGGPTTGAHTINRFFVLHVMILPLAIMGLATLHIYLFRKAGPAGPYKGTHGELTRTSEYFFPRQVYKDSVAIGIVFLITCALAFYEPVELLQEATPEPGDYNPIPEWYFLFIFQMLRYEMFSGEWGQIIGSIVIPMAFMIWLVAIPFIFRNPERRLWKRKLGIATWALILFAVAWLTYDFSITEVH
ncbi:MAG: quinol:cytochrome C oxidoreductase [Nitrospiraceae bacterium]|nr:quinol:cytochrome C oxidoreductase [Nitrospiraceae bacterium]|tara:strand:- start:390 stop:1469 length:1080 start_codon:yes stop_codon:yes gene_type:complete